MPTETTVNLANLVAAQAARHPWKRAVVYPQGRDRGGRVSYTHLTYAQLAGEIDAFARGFREIGVTPGMKAVLMVRPSLEFLPLTLALLKLGAVPVLIDPGMGLGKLLHCIRQSAPGAFVGIPIAHVIRLLRRGAFAGIGLNVTIGRRWFWGGHDLGDIRRTEGAPLGPATTRAADLAAIVFTTGSTGPPKGVEYTHGMFVSQVEALGAAFGLGGNDVDLPGFALFALFTVAMGMTVVIPDMDPTRPARVVPERIVEAVHNHGVTTSFGSPALWKRVAAHCTEQGIALPSLRAITMAGAPIPGELHEQLLNGILADGADIFTPYGATECLPVTSLRGSEILRETLALTRAGRGYCVGQPLPGIAVRIIRLSDGPLTRWADVEVLPPGEIGEIVVQGPVVSRRYHGLEEATRRHKIYETEDEAAGPFWHRIGDCGYLDEAGRLWFCGRQAHRVETGERTLYTVCCEAIFNAHPAVSRAALVGIGTDRYRQRPVIVIEARPGQQPADEAAEAPLRAELLALAAANPLTAPIRELLFHPDFPVDIRHNAKIFRERLGRWAAGRLPAELPHPARTQGGDR